MRAEAPGGHAMLVDGGDLWQGSGLSNARKGADMVEAANLLGIEAMTGHWEFTYGQEGLRANLDRFKGEFLAQNVFLTEEAAFNEAPAFDSASGRVFKPATVKAFGDRRVAIIGQAFPYVPIAHPKRFTPDWTFGIRDAELQALVDDLRAKEKVDAVVLLSHNGMDVDLKLASRVSGIDLILGGHTHDAVPEPIAVTNPKRQDAGLECRLERQVPGGGRSRSRPRHPAGHPLPPASGLRRPPEARCRDGGADRLPRSPTRGRVRAAPRHRGRPALPPGQLHRHDGPPALRCPARAARRGDLPVAGLPLGHHDARRRRRSRRPTCWRRPRRPIRRSTSSR